MPFPPSIATVTVTGQYLLADGTPAVGELRFTPNVQLLDGVDGMVIEAAPITVKLDDQGAFSVAVMATDDPNLAPTGWVYRVNVGVSGEPTRAMLLQFPAANSPVDISTLTPLVTPPALAGYVSLSAVGAPSGVASLDSTGNVPLAQLKLLSALVYSMPGELSAEVGTTRLYNDSGYNLKILAVRASCGAAPSGSAVTVDVNRNGSTIFTTQANRPSVGVGETTSGDATADDTSADDGDYFTVDVDQVGSGTPGSDLTVQIWIGR